MIQNGMFDKETFDAMKAGSKVVEQQAKKLNIDEMDDIRANIQE